jgi:hypothetical protein
MAAADPKDDHDVEAPAMLPLATTRSSPFDGATIRIMALGLNAWIVAVLLPGARGASPIADAVLTALPLLALLLGIAARPRARDSALGLLAVGVPVLLATAIAGRSDPALSEHYGTGTTILAASSTIAYVVAVAHALGRPSVLRSTTETKLARAARARPSARGLRALVVGTTTTVALVLAIAVPAMGTRAAAIETWGEAADEGRTIAVIAGGLIACIATAAIVGPSLRAERAIARRGEPALTITLSLVVAATGAIAWGILRMVAR